MNQYSRLRRYFDQIDACSPQVCSLRDQQDKYLSGYARIHGTRGQSPGTGWLMILGMFYHWVWLDWFTINFWCIPWHTLFSDSQMGSLPATNGNLSNQMGRQAPNNWGCDPHKWGSSWATKTGYFSYFSGNSRNSSDWRVMNNFFQPWI